MNEYPTVETFIVYTDLDSGIGHIIRRTIGNRARPLDSDHEIAATEAFKSVDGSRIRIREILTFDGRPPRRWSPDFRVTELE